MLVFNLITFCYVMRIRALMFVCSRLEDNHHLFFPWRGGGGGGGGGGWFDEGDRRPF